MSSISMLSEITRGALDPEGWQPLIDARPDWFEVIHLYGTKSGWERLKELVEAREDSVARHQAFVDRIAPAARNIHAYWLARRARRKKERQLNKAPATIHARAALARSSSAATGRRTSRCIKRGVRNPLCYAPSQTQALRQACNGLHPSAASIFLTMGGEIDPRLLPPALRCPPIEIPGDGGYSCYMRNPVGCNIEVVESPVAYRQSQSPATVDR